MALLVIGLPIRKKTLFLAAAKKRGLDTELLLIKRHNDRHLLIPPQGQSVVALKRFIDTHPMPGATIVVVPYAERAHEMEQMLQDFVEYADGIVHRPVPEHDGWPKSLIDNPDNADVEDELYQALLKLLGWEEPINKSVPSDRFRKSKEDCDDYEILGNALDRCDEVAEVRHAFLKRSAEALEDLCRKKGQVGMSLDAFFTKKRAPLAQTGGMQTSVCLMKGTRLLHQSDSNMHLKEGENTTPQAAARVYFQHLTFKDKYRMYLMYAGPHPDEKHISCDVAWDHN